MITPPVSMRGPGGSSAGTAAPASARNHPHRYRPPAPPVGSTLWRSAARQSPKSPWADGNCHPRPARWRWAACPRSEEHTSELQSRSDLVCRLLLEKKKKTKNNIKYHKKKKKNNKKK